MDIDGCDLTMTMFFENGYPRCPMNGKVSWPTKAEALRRYRQRKGDRRRCFAFRCSVCDMYHIGHK